MADQLRKASPESSASSDSKDDEQSEPSQSSQSTDSNEISQPSSSSSSDTSIPESRQSSLVGNSLQQQASRILLGFLGAVQGSRYSVNAFLEELLAAYL